MFAHGAANIPALVAFGVGVLILLYWLARGRKRPETGPSGSSAAVLRTTQYRQFDQRFRASLQLKDQASLASALRLRQEATELVRDVPALYCLGKHHEMILEYNHIGTGVAARHSAMESLTNEDAFREISVALYPMFSSNSYQESLLYMTGFSTSYEEALHFATKLKEQFPAHPSRVKYDEIKRLQGKYGRWFKAHRAISHGLYTRDKPETDHGQYAAGLAVLDVILNNAQAVGYNLDYEEYVDVLDDVLALATQLLMQKGARRPRGVPPREEADELGCILERPMKYLREFYPDCLPKDRDLFGRYYKVLGSVPWIDRVHGWRELTSIMT